MSYISVIVAFFYIPVAHGITSGYFRRVGKNGCTLILGCTFDQVPARSIGECALLTPLFGGRGTYYNTSTNLCHVCKLTSTFIEITSDVGYYTKGKLHAVVRTGKIPVNIGDMSDTCSSLCILQCANSYSRNEITHSAPYN